ncbi:hypothetical protein NN561_001478 [Cricetulus griseus]
MPFQSPRRLPDLNSPSGSVFEREEETVACPPARGDSTRAPPSPAPSPCQAHELLPASTVPPAPGRQLPRRPPLHQSPTSAPGRGHARLPPAPARPPPGARQQAEEAPAGEGVRGRVGTRTHQVGAHRSLRQHQSALRHQEDLDVGKAGHLLFLLLVPLRLVPLQLAAPAAARRASRLLPLHPSPAAAAAAAAFPLAPGVVAVAGRGCALRGCVLSPPRTRGGRPRPAAAGEVEGSAPRRRRARPLPPPPSPPPPPPPSPCRLLQLGLCQSQGLLAPPAASPPSDARRCLHRLPLAPRPRLLSLLAPQTLATA